MQTDASIAIAIAIHRDRDVCYRQYWILHAATQQIVNNQPHIFFFSLYILLLIGSIKKNIKVCWIRMLSPLNLRYDDSINALSFWMASETVNGGTTSTYKCFTAPIIVLSSVGTMIVLAFGSLTTFLCALHASLFIYGLLTTHALSFPVLVAGCRKRSYEKRSLRVTMEMKKNKIKTYFIEEGNRISRSTRSYIRDQDSTRRQWRNMMEPRKAPRKSSVDRTELPLPRRIVADFGWDCDDVSHLKLPLATIAEEPDEELAKESPSQPKIYYIVVETVVDCCDFKPAPKFDTAIDLFPEGFGLQAPSSRPSFSLLVDPCPVVEEKSSEMQFQEEATTVDEEPLAQEVLPAPKKAAVPPITGSKRARSDEAAFVPSKRRRVGELSAISATSVTPSPKKAAVPSITGSKRARSDEAAFVPSKRRRVGELSAISVTPESAVEPMDWELDISHLQVPLATIQEEAKERLPTIMESPEEDEDEEDEEEKQELSETPQVLEGPPVQGSSTPSAITGSKKRGRSEGQVDLPPTKRPRVGRLLAVPSAQQVPIGWDLGTSHLRGPLATIPEEEERLPTIMESPEEEEVDEDDEEELEDILGGEEDDTDLDFGPSLTGDDGVDVADVDVAGVDVGPSPPRGQPALRRSTRLATRGLGSAMTGAGRRYSLRLAEKRNRF